MVEKNLGGHLGNASQGGVPSNSNITMLNSMIGLSTWAKNYDIPKANLSKDQPSTSQSNGHINIDRPTLDLFPPHPKGETRRTIYNPNDRAIQHYSIIEYLAQERCAMSTLEVLQSCPSQRKALLAAIKGLIPWNWILSPLM